MEGVFAPAYCPIAANVNSKGAIVYDALRRQFYICSNKYDSNNHVEKALLNMQVTVIHFRWRCEARTRLKRYIYYSVRKNQPLVDYSHLFGCIGAVV
ncbi:uncharacterized protein BDR25DRAFT_362997 [Lindgomyces ingoldianus]|uniref:Uncharacterized protein n=1 Tax=Lindgomyces ingoldianus TaxID=673940 RepID=A0ACB6Q8R2_9PLEO|nr:uncharacterized protein BDR25DRAFT_362997 [Lindgomyces ingoldianus]KAF2463275.1 hypothetical protein BDR25DRAFT_362997 [Lindgomyces ingoldianus]